MDLFICDLCAFLWLFLSLVGEVRAAQVSYLFSVAGIHVYGITKLYVITPDTFTG